MVSLAVTFELLNFTSAPKRTGKLFGRSSEGVRKVFGKCKKVKNSL